MQRGGCHEADSKSKERGSMCFSRLSDSNLALQHCRELKGKGVVGVCVWGAGGGGCHTQKQWQSSIAQTTKLFFLRRAWNQPTWQRGKWIFTCFSSLKQFFSELVKALRMSECTCVAVVDAWHSLVYTPVWKKKKHLELCFEIGFISSVIKYLRATKYQWQTLECTAKTDSVAIRAAASKQPLDQLRIWTWITRRLWRVWCYFYAESDLKWRHKLKMAALTTQVWLLLSPGWYWHQKHCTCLWIRSFCFIE